MKKIENAGKISLGVKNVEKIRQKGDNQSQRQWPDLKTSSLPQWKWSGEWSGERSGVKWGGGLGKGREIQGGLR